MILALDPGTIYSGYVIYDKRTHTVPEFSAHILNTDLALKISTPGFLADIDELAVEYIASYGMPLDDDTLRTQYWVGYFAAVFQIYSRSKPVHVFYRKTVLAQMCGSAKAKTTHLTASLCNKFKEPLHPKRPIGPLKGITSHAWSALAVAMTRAEGVMGVNHTWSKE